MELELKDKIVFIVDDSIIRGNVMLDAIRKLRSAGVRKVYFGSYTPPIGQKKGGVEHGCLFGVDMPPSDIFVARQYDLNSKEGYQALLVHTGAAGIYWVSTDKLIRALQQNPETLCTFCIGGPNPIKTAWQHELKL